MILPCELLLPQLALPRHILRLLASRCLGLGRQGLDISALAPSLSNAMVVLPIRLGALNILQSLLPHALLCLLPPHGLGLGRQGLGVPADCAVNSCVVLPILRRQPRISQGALPRMLLGLNAPESLDLVGQGLCIPAMATGLSNLAIDLPVGLGEVCRLQGTPLRTMFGLFLSQSLRLGAQGLGISADRPLNQREVVLVLLG
mmetsp:Transcript_75637/g.162193  ORF Transcript_75637/g.162193 Transcript_75637/m.162193 type:complete len:202 (+) Transcript_75637:560-1165(+)